MLTLGHKRYFKDMKAAVFGASGLVGRQLVGQLTEKHNVESIQAFARNKPHWLQKNVSFEEFSLQNFRFNDSPTHVFCALGTTMKKAGSKQAFLNVDLHAVVQIAQRAKDAGAKNFAVVSSIGANAQSGNFYLRTKGQMEEALKQMNFERLVIVRPSLLLGNRNEKRLGEDVGKMLYRLFQFLFVDRLRKYRGIEALNVARAMIWLMENTGEGVTIAESDDLQRIAQKSS